MAHLTSCKAHLPRSVLVVGLYSACSSTRVSTLCPTLLMLCTENVAESDDIG